MKALRKDFLMQIKKTKNRFLSIMAIVALGVSFYAGITSTEPDMRYTADYFYDENNMCDIKIVSTLGLTDRDLEKVKGVEGISSAVGSYSFDNVAVFDDKESTLKFMSLTKGINDISLKDGRLPANGKECLVDNQLTEHTYKIGDVITVDSENLKNNKLTIVGSFSTPLYISRDKGTTTVGNGKVDGLVILLDDAFDMECYTEIYAKTVDTDKYISASDKYEDAVEVVTKRIEDTIKADCEKVRYQEIVDEANEKIADGEKELADGQKEYDDGLSEYNDGVTKLDEAKDELEDAEDEIEKGEKELADAKDEIDNGEKELDDAEAEIAKNEKDLEEGYKEYNKGLKAYKKGLKQYKKGLSEYKTGYKKYQEGLASYNKGLAEYNAAVAIYGEALLAGQKAELDGAKTTLDTTEKELTAGKAKLDASDKKLKKANKKLKKSKKKLDDGKTEIEEAKALIAEKRSELEDGKAEYEEGLEKLESSKKKVTKGWKKINKSQKKLDDAKAELEDGAKELDDARKEIEDAKKDVAKLAKAEWYVLDRNYIESYVEYDMDASRIGNIGKVFPIFFFLVAAMVCLTTMTRMVEENRTEIGTYKALGYNTVQIAGKYLLYAFLATLIGGVLGGIAGSYVFPVIIIKAYGIMFINLENLIIKIDPFFMGISIIIAVLSITAAALLSCIGELKSTPAALMRPEAPKVGKKVLLERIPFIWNRLSFNMKSTFRNLFRYKKRLFMTLFGVGGSCALMLVGYGIKDSIMAVRDVQYEEISKYDMVVTYNTEDYEDSEIDRVKKWMEKDKRIDKFIDLYQTSTKGSKDKKNYSAYIYVPADKTKLNDYIDIRNRVGHQKIELSDDGVIIDEKYAKLLDAKEGDTIYLEDEDGIKMPCVIEGIYENYAFHYVYMSPKYYEKIFGQHISYNASLVKNTDGNHEYSDELASDILANEEVGGVNFLSVAKENVANMLVSMNGIIMVLIVCAGALAFVVLYNLNNVNIAERKRELATLKVLGFYDGEVSGYIYRENIIITIMGIGIGLILGKALLLFVILEAEIDSMMFGREVSTFSYAMSIMLTILFAVIINYVMHLSLKKVDMASSLKSVE